MIHLVLLSLCAWQQAGENSLVSFGERQISQMLDDRPDMRGLFDEDAPVFRWLIWRFEGWATVKSRVYWNAEEPLSGFSAEHARKYWLYPAHERVSSSKHLSRLDKWISVVFEVNNLKNTDASRVLLSRV